MRLIDTHCHIDLKKFDDDRDNVLARAKCAGVSDLLLIAFEPERWRTSIPLSERHRNIKLAVGLHPTSADQYSSDILASIEELTRRSDVVAIGETGIDLYWDKSTLELQQHAFRAQVELAQNLEVPFIVHQRDAEQEVLDVLSSFSAPLRGVLHCFTGNWDYAKKVLDLGMHIGLGGAVTFKSRTELHEAAARIPLDRMVLETDSPFMAPTPHRGKRNEPSYVRIVAERIAELRSEELDTIADVTTQSAMELFSGLGQQT